MKAYLKAIACLVTIMGMAGCTTLPSHIHNEKNAEIANQARIDMRAYTEQSPNIYTAMLANLELFKAEEDRLLLDFAANHHDALVTKLPTMTWGDLLARTNVLQDSLDDFESHVLEVEARDYLTRKGVDTQNIADAKAAIKRYQKAIEAEEERIDNWNAFMAMLEQAIRQSPSLGAALANTETLKGAAETVATTLNTEVEYKDHTGAVKKKPVKEILAAAKRQLDSKGNRALETEIEETRGEPLLVLDLGLNLARLEKRRAEESLVLLEERRELLNRSLSELFLARAWLDNVKNELQSGFYTLKDSAYLDLIALWKLANREVTTIQGYGGPIDGKFMVRADKLRNSTNAVSETLLLLRAWALSEHIINRNEALLTVGLKRLDHQASIVESAIGDTAYNALINSGLETLVAYHEGGITPDDIANLIRAGQTIALGIIADETSDSDVTVVNES